MNKVIPETNLIAFEKYKTLVSIISKIEDRLRMSELVYLVMNVMILLGVVAFVAYLSNKGNYFFTYTDLALVFLCISSGMAIDICWIAYAMRVQLKLKLRYFQARSLERKFNVPDENIFSDEHVFFDPDIKRLESHDKSEVLTFATKGSLKMMDRIFGSFKPSLFSWLLPHMFFAIYCVIFILVLTRI